MRGQIWSVIKFMKLSGIELGILIIGTLFEFHMNAYSIGQIVCVACLPVREMIKTGSMNAQIEIELA